MDVPHYWTAHQVQRLLDALAAHNRHQARTAALIMWRTGLRVSEVLELEWRDLDYAGEPATLLVRRSKTRRARTVRLHPELVQLFTNWPANRSPRDRVVPLTMRTALRHISDGIRWADLDEESPGTGKRRPGAHSLRHSAARHWLMVGRVPLNVVSSWLGHANVQGDAADLPAHRGQRPRHGERAVAGPAGAISATGRCAICRISRIESLCWVGGPVLLRRHGSHGLGEVICPHLHDRGPLFDERGVQVCFHGLVFWLVG